MQRNLIVVLIASLSIGMGCSGAEGPLGSPVGTGTGPDGGSTPVFAPGGGGDVDVNDDGGATPAAPAARPPANPAPGKPKAPSIECFEKIFPEGSVGSFYDHKLIASEGTPPFQYALKNGAKLPDGLALSADSRISGTPEEAGNFKPKVVVTDEGGKKNECKTQIVVKGDLGINVAANDGQGRWDAVYSINVSDNIGDVQWTWVGDLDNVCMSGTAPDVGAPDFRDECTAGSKIASGRSAFLWLKADRQGAEALSLKLTVTSEYAKAPTSHDFEFEYTPSPACGNNIKEGLEACDGTDVEEGYTCNADCTKSPFAVSIQVETWTGDAGGDSDTDSTISIKFCKDKEMSGGLVASVAAGAMSVSGGEKRCTGSIALGDLNDDDEYENGEKNTTVIPFAPFGITDKYQYFQIKHNGGGGYYDDTPNWLLQGIRVKIIYSDGSKYTYFNPCIEKWMDEGDRLPFGPNDTAVCAIVETGTLNDAGTDDLVHLVFENFDAIAADDGLVHTSISDWSPHFAGGRSDDEYLMELGWHIPIGNPDDFENGDKNSYGDYLFDVKKPYGRSAPKFHFEKDEDGDYGGWLLEGYEVFVFQPARVSSSQDQDAQNPAVYHKKAASYHTWLGGATLVSNSVTLDAVEPSEIAQKITPAIGRHWED